jgi:hypothetical protein
VGVAELGLAMNEQHKLGHSAAADYGRRQGKRSVMASAMKLPTTQILGPEPSPSLTC